jgi:hypothetical protein
MSDTGRAASGTITGHAVDHGEIPRRPQTSLHELKKVEAERRRMLDTSPFLPGVGCPTAQRTFSTFDGTTTPVVSGLR